MLATKRIEKLMSKSQQNSNIEPVVAFIDPLSAGAFMNQSGVVLTQRIDSIHVEEENVTMNIQYLCSCGLTVYELLGRDLEFGCPHCDSVCTTPKCQQCLKLMSVDYGAEESNEDL